MILAAMGVGALAWMGYWGWWLPWRERLQAERDAHARHLARLMGRAPR
jgi:hypothetical protein